MDQLDGCMIIVTGCSSGIGEGVCKALLLKLAHMDVKIVGFDVKKPQFQDEKFSFFRCDLSDGDQIIKVFEDIVSENPGRMFGILVNNCGISKAIPILNEILPQHVDKLILKPTSEEVYENYSEITAVNIIAPALLTRLVSSHMDHREPGFIFNISSTRAHFVSDFPGSHFYSVTKHAMKALTISTQKELALIKSRVSCCHICPDPVN